MNQKAVEAAINEFRGPHNRGLRAKLRRAAYEPGSYIPAARVRMLSEVVALDSLGQSRLEAVARAVEAQAPLATYKGADDFEQTYPGTAYKNIGSQMEPLMIADACNCPDSGNFR